MSYRVLKESDTIIKSVKKIITAVCVLGMVLVAGQAMGGNGNGNGHDFSKENCIICHLLSKDGEIITTKENFTYQCGFCHKEVISSICQHKVDIPFTGHGTAKLLPLSSSGNITCNTCHDVHSASRTPLGISTHYLQVAMCITNLCLLCHDDTTLKHSGMFRTAHLMPLSPKNIESQEIDSLSKRCLSCHDGVTAKSQPVNTRSGAGCYSAGVTLNHPVGIDYLKARMKNGKRTSLLPLEKVNKKILFFGNKISCGSCHDPYSAKNKKLRVDNYRSKLCLSCHRR